MSDLYCYPDSNILKNKLNIQNHDLLMKAEADFVMARMKQLHQKPLEGRYDFKHFCCYHRYLFQDIYEWAGVPRTVNLHKAERLIGFQSIEYADKTEIPAKAEAVLKKMRETPWERLNLDKKAEAFSQSLADLWKVHSFREGNTRSSTLFCLQFAESRNIPIDRNIMENSGAYLRDSLVAYNAYFADADLSQKAYLLNLVKHSMAKGLEKQDRQEGIKKWEKAVQERTAGMPAEKASATVKKDKGPELG